MRKSFKIRILKLKQNNQNDLKSKATKRIYKRYKEREKNVKIEINVFYMENK